MSWSGMRGAVSLAAALAVPLSNDVGNPFPGRDLIVFLTFSVILATLVLQGLTLGPLIAALRLEGNDDTDKLAELRTRLKGARAALATLNRLREEGGSRREPKKACASTTRSASAAMQRALRPGAQRRNTRRVPQPGASGGAS